ncbi:MAG: 3-hydroxyacyl-ACP dehydratase FabZ [Dethiosulfatibacter sp.]|nr:3-hydroxyacyl-ACP dehydratase FabZ [Dethiosulfatibacter sp.]
MYMDKEQIKNIIPHRDPMLLVDEVIELKDGESIKTKFYISPDREIFKGHFPNAPVFPGIYTVECMAQTADILLLSMQRYNNTTPFFIGINNVRFMSKIEPDDTIEIHAQLTLDKKEKGIATCSTEVYNKGDLAASGEVTLAMR